MSVHRSQPFLGMNGEALIGLSNTNHHFFGSWVTKLQDQYANFLRAGSPVGRVIYRGRHNRGLGEISP
jgi:hypothetical protein